MSDSISSCTAAMVGKRVQVSRSGDDPSIVGVLDAVDDFGILLSDAVVDWSFLGAVAGQVVRYSSPVLLPWHRVELVRLSKGETSLRIA